MEVDSSQKNEFNEFGVYFADVCAFSIFLFEFGRLGATWGDGRNRFSTDCSTKMVDKFVKHVCLLIFCFF